MRGKKNKNSWVMGMANESTYQVNGVTYIVEPRFQAIDSNDAKMPQEKFARIIEKSAAHLQVAHDSDKIQAEYVLKSAGEEEYADQNQTE